MVQLKLLLDSRKPKADGTSPIYFRVTEFKKVFYLHSGHSVKEQHWQEEKRQVNRTCPNAQNINASLAKRFADIQKAIIQLEDEGLFSIERLKDKLLPKKNLPTFVEFANEIIDDMMKANRVGNAIVYRTAVNSLLAFRSNKNLKFSDLDIRFLEGYQAFLLGKALSLNSVANYMRSIRAIYNRAVAVNIASKESYPFLALNCNGEKTVKRAITVREMNGIKNAILATGSPEAIARDMFMLSFYLIGMNMTDMALAKHNNIRDGRLIYRRKKTGKIYSILLLPEALEIINRYNICKQGYLLPVLQNGILEGGLSCKRIIGQWIKTNNKYLKRLGTQLGLAKALTSYVARHSVATIAKRSGYSNEMIAQALGHLIGLSVTAIYLDDFGTDEVDKMHIQVVHSITT